MNKYRKFYVNINSECNCSCVGCLLKKENRVKVTLPLEKIKEALEYITTSTAKDVLNICEVSGGEPTIAPHFEDVLKLLAEYKERNEIYKIVVLSNVATCANMEFATMIAKYVDDVVTTFYSYDAKVHDYLAGFDGLFDKKIQAIDNLIFCGVKVHIKILLLKQSYKELPEIARAISKKWGNKVHVTINSTHYTGDAWRNVDELGVKYSEAMPYVEEALEILEEANITTSIFLPICMIDPKYWKYAPVDYSDLITRSYSITPDMQFGLARNLLDEFINLNEFCQKCPINPNYSQR